MKTNAIIRIIIWCVVIVLLGAILLAGLKFNPFYYRRASNTQIHEQTTVPAPTVEKASQKLETTSKAEPESGLDAAGTVSIPGNQVQEIDIEWVSGCIRIESADVGQIQFSESGVNDTKYTMQWKQKGNKLTIQFCESGMRSLFSFHDLSKDLTIYVPRDWTCSSLDVDTASSTLEVKDLTIREVEIDSASGACVFDNCQLEEIDVDTASGDIRITGTLNVLECDAASASVYAVLDNVPSRIEMDSVSGDLDLTLPPDAGFTVMIDSMSSDFSSDFATTSQNGSYICGNGSCRIKMSAMSGDVIIRKGS